MPSPAQRRFRHQSIACLMAWVCGAAAADPAAPLAVPDPIEQASVAAVPELRSARSPQAWSALAAAELQPAAQRQLSSVSIIELPPEGIPGTPGQRKRHALSIQSEMPQRMLRSIGIEATDCATRLRAPSRFRQEPGGGSRFTIQAQIGLACRF